MGRLAKKRRRLLAGRTAPARGGGIFYKKERGCHLQTFRNALKSSLPVMAGYLVLGAGFGMMMKAAGYGAGWALAMSVFVYAGSMQYAAVGLLSAGTGLVSLALTTLMVNARHLFYGISMLEPYRKAGAARPYLIFALTDETYSLVCDGRRSVRECLLLSLLDQGYWVAGSVAGALLGEVVPFSTQGVDFALTALFLTVFTDQWLHSDSHFPALCGVGVSAVCLAVFGPDRFLLPAMAGITALLLAGSLWHKQDARKEVTPDE